MKFANIIYIIIFSIFLSSFVFSLEINASEEVITKQIALENINESELIIFRMQNNNFSIFFVNDTLVDAKRVFIQAEYAEILRNPNSKSGEISKARQALTLVDWKNISYSSVIAYTERIRKREKEAFNIYDSLIASNLKIANYKQQDINISEAEKLINNAKIAFYEDRYEDAVNLIKQATDNLEIRASERTIISSLRSGTLTFFQNYWKYLAIFLIIFILLFTILYKKLQIIFLTRKIKKMRVQQEALQELKKKAQIERFNENKISGIVYNIRIKKYESRLETIKEELPVLENNLNKLKKEGIFRKYQPSLRKV